MRDRPHTVIVGLALLVLSACGLVEPSVTALPAAAAVPATATATDSGSDLQSFLQQLTKAVTAYAAGGPLGIAAALTSSTKA